MICENRGRFAGNANGAGDQSIRLGAKKPSSTVKTRRILLKNYALCIARATQKWCAIRFQKIWRGGRVAEGGGLLNRYTV
jgi:hypothetical protein